MSSFMSLELRKVTAVRNINYGNRRLPSTAVSKCSKHGYVHMYVPGPDPLIDL